MDSFRKKWRENRKNALLDSVTEEAVSQSGQQSVLKKAKIEIPTIETPAEKTPKKKADFQAANLQEHILGSREAVYLQRMQKKGDLNDVVLTRPRYKDVMTYIGSLAMEEQPKWYKTSTNAIVENDQLDFPNPPVLTRAYIKEFLRECKSNVNWERPCSRSECISEQMGGFRCRELLHPDDLGKVMSVEEPNRKAALPQLVGWCYLCHLADVTASYLDILRQTNEMRREAGIHIIHMFIVQVDLPGEYKLEKTCMGDEHFCGIFGPVPLFSPTNYQQVTLSSGQKGWLGKCLFGNPPPRFARRGIPEREIQFLFLTSYLQKNQTPWFFNKPSQCLFK